MDLTKIDSLETLKSLAYDQVKILNQTQQNIQLLEARIKELETADLAKANPPTKK